VTGGPGDGALDLTSSLFLGHRHGGTSFRGWDSLTTGVPAGLREDPAAAAVVAAVVAAQDAPAGLVARSTLHALGDVLGELPRAGDVVAVDELSYPVSRWAALRALERGAIVCDYRHHRPGPALGSCVPRHRRLFLVADGWCPGCGEPAPLARLRRLATAARGVVVVDDTLAAGVLGAVGAGPGGFLGDGSGTVRRLGLDHRGVLWVASLAKAYGAPLAVVTGDRREIDRLAGAGSRWHCSPPSAADLAAARAALRDPADGRRRDRLARNVIRLRRGLHAVGLRAAGRPFPVVRVPPPAGVDAVRWQHALGERGVRVLVQRPRCRPRAVLMLLVRADHRDGELDRAVRELGATAAAARRRSA
jgi:8-amino-7-oxononanoate synthase